MKVEILNYAEGFKLIQFFEKGKIGSQIVLTENQFKALKSKLIDEALTKYWNQERGLD